jgi:hypothetical protein
VIASELIFAPLLEDFMRTLPRENLPSLAKAFEEMAIVGPELLGPRMISLGLKADAVEVFGTMDPALRFELFKTIADKCRAMEKA